MNEYATSAWRDRAPTERMAVVCLAFLIAIHIFYVLMSAIAGEMSQAPNFALNLYNLLYRILVVSSAWLAFFSHLLLTFLFFHYARKAQPNLPTFWTRIVAVWLLWNGLELAFGTSLFRDDVAPPPWMPDDYLADVQRLNSARLIQAALYFIAAGAALFRSRWSRESLAALLIIAPCLWLAHMWIVPSASQVQEWVANYDMAQQPSAGSAQRYVTLGTPGMVTYLHVGASYACLAAATYLVHRKRPHVSQPAPAPAPHP